jgi:hypothetical protein
MTHTPSGLAAQRGFVEFDRRSPTSSLSRSSERTPSRVTWQLSRAAIVDVLTAVLAPVATAALGGFKINPIWLIVGGARHRSRRPRLGVDQGLTAPDTAPTAR